MKRITRDQCFQNDCRRHRQDKIRASYYPREYDVKQSLNSKNAEKRRAIKVLRTELRREGSEKTIPDVGSLQLQVREILKQRDLDKEPIAINNAMIQARQATIAHQQQSLEISNLTLRMMQQQYEDGQQEM